ncbi:MAG: YggT family protein [Actinomycetota bacterium]|nr:YggT family protein [Actinomycetota bacterium]
MSAFTVAGAALAIDRVDVARYVNVLFTVYIALIFIRIVLSWIPRMPYNPVLRAVVGFVGDVTDPYLNLFRRILPPVRLGPAALDLSPIVGIFLLVIVQGIVVSLIAG